MSVRMIRTLVLSLILVFVAAPLASAAKGEKGEGGGPIARILKHASELGLTSDQVKQLEALKTEAQGKEKGDRKELRGKVKAILTPEQIEKIKKFMEEHKKAK